MELLLVIAILSITVGMVSAGISLVYSRDAEKCAKLINSALEETRMRSLSQEGTFLLSVDGDTKILSITSSKSSAAEETKLPENVDIAVSAEGDAGGAAGKKITVEFDKAAGKVKEVTIDGAALGKDSYHTVKISAEARQNSKKASVYLIKLTGKHYIEYHG